MLKRVLWGSILVVLSACGSGGDTAALGAWKLTGLTGKIQRDYLVCGTSSTTFVPSALSTAWNDVKVDHLGNVQYYLAFDNAGDSYNIGADGKATGGTVTGNTVASDTGTTVTASGTYDSSAMTVTWSYRQHSESGGCGVDVKGDGTFTATSPQ